jgi:HK97 gp10 family phage protein
MGEPIAIKIENADQIRRAYSKAPAQMTKALSVAIKTAVFLIQGRSMSNTPVLTGRLRGSHYTKFEPLRGEVGTDPSREKGSRGVDYSTFVHEGTRFMPARPYLRSAVEESNGEINDLFTKATQDVLNDIGKSV